MASWMVELSKTPELKESIDKMIILLIKQHLINSFL